MTGQALHAVANRHHAHSGPGWTCFRVDGGMWMIGDAVVVPALAGGGNDGTHWITFYSVDAVGNVEQAVQTCPVVIDVLISPTSCD